MNKLNCNLRKIAMSLMMSVAYAMPIVAQDQNPNQVFNPKMLKQFKVQTRNGPSDVTIFKVFEAFTPTTPEHVDWCYMTFDNRISSEIRSLAKKKLAALRDPALLTASRKHLFDKDKVIVKIALHNIVVTNDQAALADLRRLEGIKAEPAKQLYFLVRQTRAKLHDPELLKELTDPQKQTPDSTLAMYNRELLKEYGEEGAKMLLAMEQSSKASKEQVNKYLSEIKDEKQVPNLLKRYRELSETKGDKSDRKRQRAILESLIRINSRECQSLFREMLAKPVEKLQPCESSEIDRIAMQVWYYNTRENEKFQDQYIAKLKMKNDSLWFGWPRLKDKNPEIVLLIAEKLKNPKESYYAAKALREILGQQFQYIPPACEWARKKANENVRKTSMTPEEIEKDRQRDLKNMNDHLDKLKKSGKMRQDIYGIYAKDHLDAINKQYDDLLISAKKPSEWEQGIPIDEAAAWIMNYYHIQPQTKESVSNEKK